jgi:hypothetical protein
VFFFPAIGVPVFSVVLYQTDNKMKTLSYLLALTAIFFVTGCNEVEDPGPLQEISREFAILDFDHLEMGSGFNIEVNESDFFRVKARGDRRNINDLHVYKTGNTLRIEYREQANRRHETYISIEMPSLNAVSFSGGSISVIKGFESDGVFNCYLSGGSMAQLYAGYRRTNVILSGASILRMHGLGDELTADLSGASMLTSFDYPVRDAVLTLSGASSAKVTVSDELGVTATGASSLLYRGNPVVEKSISGGSSVGKD